MKITLHLAPVNGGPFNCMPARSVELEAARILCNDIVLPFERHPHNVRLFVVGNEFGALGAVWAGCEQDALDALVDAGLGDGLLVDENDLHDDEREDCTRLGNAGEAADLDHAWLQVVQFDAARDCALLCRFAEARGAGASDLDDGRLPV